MLSSAHLGLKHCNRCGQCCKDSPCLLEESDIDRIAAHLRMDREEFVRTKLDVQPVDRMGAVKPKRNERGCIFLKGNDCGINRVKPKGGRDYECWVPQDGGTRYLWSSTSLSKIGVMVECP
jgi:Fe-S-cluster containining protein